MKKLTRLKLINWHRFSDVTIDFGDSTLISGENGAGKSTLLDAIQFVVTCSTNHFNKAAHENGKRKRPVISGVRPDVKIILMREPERSVRMSHWNFMRRARKSILSSGQ